MIFGDYHTHTTYCDGVNTPEEMLLAAIAKGLKVYGFSSHSHLSYEEDWNMSIEAQEDYIKEVLALKEKYKDKIEVLLGTEFDLFSDNDISKFDYVIGSCHCIFKNGNYISVDHSEKNFIDCVNKYYDGDSYGFVKDYYDVMATAAQKKGITFYGHFNVVNKFNKGERFFKEDDVRFEAPMYSSLEKLAKSGRPLELNSKTTYGYSASEPIPSTLKWLSALSEMGGDIIITSDAHNVNSIGYNFELSAKTAKNCGFSHALVLTPNGFEEIKL